MELNQLRYFSTVAKTGSMRKAAELLHVTPAALSKSICTLERELGEKLILPSGRGIIISDIGNRFAVRAESILADLENLKQTSHRKPSLELLRLASFEVFTTWLLAPIVKKLSSDVPILI